MLAATGGVNTHKGAVYAFGLILAALGSVLARGGELFRTAAALAAAGISVVRRWVALEVPCTYALFEGARRGIQAFDGVVENVDYGADVLISALLPEDRAAPFAAHILDTSSGSIQVLESGEQFKAVPWRAPVR